MKETVTTLAIEIGMKLIPIVTSVIDWFTKHKQIVTDLGVVILAVVGFLALYGAATFAVETYTKAVTVATKLWAATQWLLNAALDANPIGAVILVVAGLVGSVVYAYEHFKTFRDIVNTVWTDLEKTTGTAVSLMIGFFKGWLDAWMTVVGGILDGAAKAFGWVPGVGGKLKAAAKAFDGMRSDINTTLSGLASDAAGWGQSTGDALAAGVRNSILANISSVNQAAQALGFAAASQVHKGAGAASPSKLTYYTGQMIAAGLKLGIAHGQGGAAAAGQALGAAAAGAVSGDATIQASISGGSAIGAASAASSGGSGGGGTTINIYAAVMTIDQAAEQIRQALLRKTRRVGALGLA
jgi:hypothetical protein